MLRSPLETGTSAAIRDHQLTRLNALLQQILPANRFYAAKFAGLALPVDWDAFRRLPFTTKSELVGDQAAHPPLGTVATYPVERYVVYHQTSGTTGRPMTVMDTEESWTWWAECWRYVYAAAGVTAADRIFFAFSFGPFIGFWSAYHGARRLGALTIPGGGMDSRTRVEVIARTCPTVLVSTPTYALRLAEVAREVGLDGARSSIRVTIHAGEPGASIPAVRSRIEEGWGARCYDHTGATEIGAYGYMCEAQTAVHVNEAEFIAEVLDSATGEPVGEGERGELVVTNLGRAGWPVIRYRTGDLVTRGAGICSCGRTFLALPGGIAGRADDLMIVRGINVYPSSIEAIVRQFDVDEFRIVRTRCDEMEELELHLESTAAVAEHVANALRRNLGIRIPTTVVPGGSLPRFELKARRVLDLRQDHMVADGNRPSGSQRL